MNQEPVIVYAEDDADDLEMLQEALKMVSENCRLIHTKNGKEVIELFLQQPALASEACIILLDINMPLVDGKETLGWLKQQQALQHMPVVMFTTSEYALDIHRCEEMGAKVINKPLLFSDLVTVARDIIEICQTHYVT